MGVLAPGEKKIQNLFFRTTWRPGFFFFLPLMAKIIYSVRELEKVT